jgi:hypothetical protein
MSSCKCGRALYTRPNSTIQNKLCPNCQLNAARRTETRQIKSFGKNRCVAMGKKTGAKNSLKNADMWFSRFIRVKHSVVRDGEIFCKDIITGKYYQTSNIDNGHYISRYHMATRFEESNCRPQNRSSNRFRGEADKFKFQENLIKEIGQDEFNRIEALARNSSFKYGEHELKEIADKYRRWTNELLKQKGAKKWW